MIPLTYSTGHKHFLPVFARSVLKVFNFIDNGFSGVKINAANLIDESVLFWG
jgi:hypothetical protein